MSLRQSLRIAAVLALVLGWVVPAHAQSSTTTTSTTKHTESVGMAKATMKSSGTKAAAAAKVDINTASKDELMALPGIGDAIADKIVANRPFANKHQLLDKGLVNAGQYRAMSPHIIASHASVKTTTTMHAVTPGAAAKTTTTTAKRTTH